MHSLDVVEDCLLFQNLFVDQEALAVTGLKLKLAVSAVVERCKVVRHVAVRQR